MQFVNRFHSLGTNFYTQLSPQGLPKPKLVSASTACSDDYGLQSLSNNTEALLAVTAGNALLEGMQPLAAVYSGHQFGSYNPQLGDGRALLLGEAKTTAGHCELQLKGAGETPYSRSADGRAVLRSSIREYLCSEAMHGLGISTTRALSIVHSDLPVYRETPETASCVMRVAPSFIRFGSFEFFHYNNKPEAVRALADHILSAHLPKLAAEPDCYAQLLRHTVHQTALTIAQWQAVGFAHGVMNTDNMSILGLTMDYGPFGFLDDYDPHYICNHSDYQGRYAFDQQPSIALWNLNALGNAFTSLMDTPDIIDILKEFEPQFLVQHDALMRKKLGLLKSQDNDMQLVASLLALMKKERSDYTNTFRSLCDNDENPAGFIDNFIDRNAAQTWLESYQQRLQIEASSPTERKTLMKSHNPKYILRNYLAQNAISQAEQGDYSEVNTLLDILSKPYDEQYEFESYAKRPPNWGKHLEISCSS